MLYIQPMIKPLIIASLCFITLVVTAQSKTTITFKSQDGIIITADSYMPHSKAAPVIVLFHQANWSRGEYLEIAPELNTLGFNCIAVDLRSGGAINNVTNMTKLNAAKAMKSTQYIDAIPDMKAAVKYAKNNLTDGKVIVWGSSYSSALSLKLAGQMNEIDAVMAFSPAEYFVSQGKARDFVTSDAGNIFKPVFITSAKSEKSSWWSIYVAIPSENKTFYLPESSGNHGSRALWSKFADSPGYWNSVKNFLKSL